MPEMPSHIEIALSTIQVFADDGTIDLGELNYLLGLALRDNRIDADERRVLQNLFAKIKEADVEPRVWQRIAQVRKQYEI